MRGRSQLDRVLDVLALLGAKLDPGLCPACGTERLPYVWRYSTVPPCPICRQNVFVVERTAGGSRIIHGEEALRRVEAERGPLARWRVVDGHPIDTNPNWRQSVRREA